MAGSCSLGKQNKHSPWAAIHVVFSTPHSDLVLCVFADHRALEDMIWMRHHWFVYALCFQSIPTDWFWFRPLSFVILYVQYVETCLIFTIIV